VRECKDKFTGEAYAVKIFRSEDEEMFKHAEEEFNILRHLDGHPNIVQAIDYVQETHRGYLIMEKVEGYNLLNYIMDNGPLTEDIAKAVIR
jgi:serine/threonine protein kinase